MYFEGKKKLLEKIIEMEKELKESEALLEKLKDGTLRYIFYRPKDENNNTEISLIKRGALGSEVKKVLINTLEDEIQILKVRIFNLKKLF